MHLFVSLSPHVWGWILSLLFPLFTFGENGREEEEGRGNREGIYILFHFPPFFSEGEIGGCVIFGFCWKEHHWMGHIWYETPIAQAYKSGKRKGKTGIFLGRPNIKDGGKEADGGKSKRRREMVFGQVFFCRRRFLPLCVYIIHLPGLLPLWRRRHGKYIFLGLLVNIQGNGDGWKKRLGKKVFFAPLFCVSQQSFTVVFKCLLRASRLLRSSSAAKKIRKNVTVSS